MRAQHRLGRARRRHDEHRHGAEAEEHDVGAVLPGEPVEGDVRERAHQVEVARPGRAELEAKAAVGEGCRRHRRLAAPAPASSWH